MSTLTPLLKQYHSIKKKFQDAILLFRVGDFYETFYGDAELSSKVLNITLTSRNHGKSERVPLAGVPVKSAETYISRLVKSGYKVAICEQLEEPQKGKKIVDRDVIEVITPGTITIPSLLDKKTNIYIMGIYGENGRYGLAFADTSTGEFYAGLTEDPIIEIQRINPQEIVLREGESISIDIPKTFLDESIFNFSFCEEVLKKQFNIHTIQSLGLEDEKEIIAAGSLIWYISDTQRANLSHIKKITHYSNSDYMFLDKSTIRNLEIFKKIDGSYEGSLVSSIDYTITPMGGRLLKKYLLFPLKNKNEIKKRLNFVKEFYDNISIVYKLREELKNIQDIERLTGRIATSKANPRDVYSLALSIDAFGRIKNLLLSSNLEIIKKEIIDIEELDFISKKIKKTIIDSPPVSISDGNFIKEGVSSELDELRNISRNGKKWLIEFEKREKEKTGISSLKVGYNTVFGYYIEVTKSNLSLVPNHYIRKQTLTNAERFITDELKNFEEKILGAEEKIKKIELEIFSNLREELKEEIDKLKSLSDFISRIDIYSSFALLAYENDYTIPEITEENVIKIKDGRHPVVEKILPPGDYIPNSTDLNEEEIIHIITGPNMAGKSTYLRQVALIVLLSQIGSFVPAKEAKIGVVDRIFTRIGASDDLSRGVSTFLAEMNETSVILNNVSERSLVILDEIGRGTSTYDGLAIAWACVEFFAKMVKPPKVLFATHYHELTDIESYYKNIVNYTVDVKESEEGIIFLRKLRKGKADRSYGIEVAKLAGLPESVIRRAKEILKDLEKDDRVIYHHPPKYFQVSLFKDERDLILERLKKIEPEKITPIEALNILYELKKISKGDYD
uniref:DNA mismatch repair protein MutS n=1 Tax=candidate division WOR-3 bacterium TaxID=2052148 RepID=A0A7C4Y436_UNCW3